MAPKNEREARNRASEGTDEVRRNTSGMRLLPNTIRLFLLVVGSAWALAGLGYIRDTAMSGSYLWTGCGILAAFSGVVIHQHQSRAVPLMAF